MDALSTVKLISARAECSIATAFQWQLRSIRPFADRISLGHGDWARNARQNDKSDGAISVEDPNTVGIQPIEIAAMADLVKFERDGAYQIIIGADGIAQTFCGQKFLLANSSPSQFPSRAALLHNDSNIFDELEGSFGFEGFQLFDHFREQRLNVDFVIAEADSDHEPLRKMPPVNQSTSERIRQAIPNTQPLRPSGQANISSVFIRGGRE